MKYKFAPMHAGEEIGSCKELYDSKNEIRERLASFHSGDWDSERDVNTLTLDELLEYGQWEIIEISFECPLCREGDVEYKEWMSAHIYSCNECPFLALEYYGTKDIAVLTDYLKFNS